MWNSQGDEDGLWWVNLERVKTRATPVDQFNDRAERVRALHFDAPAYTPPPLTAPPPGYVAIDLETEDPDLHTRGPSWAFEDRGQILGVAIAWQGFEAYYSFGHRDGNVDPEPVYRWLTDTLGREDVETVYAHAAYDVGWLRKQLGIYPRRSPRDVQFQAALLDENRLSYGLDAVSQSYLGEGKAYGMIDMVADRVLCKRGEVFNHLKQLPASMVAPYAIPDATLTYRLHVIMDELLRKEELYPVYQLECDLITLSVEMRRRGIRVDVDGTHELLEQYQAHMADIQARIKVKTGVDVSPWEAESCALALEEEGLKVPRTATDKPSVTKELLGALAQSNEVAGSILQLRKLSKACTTFLEGHILTYADNGRIHPTYNQLRRDDSDHASSMRGTVSGRYSCDSPNVQQLPIRDPEIGKAVRRVFLPEDGQLWCSLDYMSQEPRLQVEFAYRARLPGAAATVQAYRDNPRLDGHQWVADLCGISRQHAKTINLARAYGMASAALARSLGLGTKWMAVLRGRWVHIEEYERNNYIVQGYDVVEVGDDQTMDMIRTWETHAPFMKGFINLATQTAKKRGFVKTLLGRRCRFTLSADGYEFTHAAANRIVQGSAADQTKTAMLHMWRDGIVPMLTLHDELGFSVDNEAEGLQRSTYMIDAIPLAVPMVCDPKLGRNWAESK